MRTIKKRDSPEPLKEWREQRIAWNDDAVYPFNYEALRRNRTVLAAVEDSLFAEQGQICAYTGRHTTRKGRPGLAGFHIEHLKPQDHCGRGEDCAYGNLAACWPEPNQTGIVGYGAVRKGNWPTVATDHLFISPLHAACTSRFHFAEREDPSVPGMEAKWSNWMEAATPGDAAAEETIHQLNLNHHELRSLRSSAVFGALTGPDGDAWTLEQLKAIAAGYGKAENQLDAGSDIALDAFCFAIRQALAFHIQQRETGRRPG